MPKKMKGVCLSMDQNMQDILKQKAHAKDQNVSDFVRQLLGYFALDREDVKPVVLQIPKEVLASRERLERWLRQRTDGLLNQFFPPEAHPSVRGQ